MVMVMAELPDDVTEAILLLLPVRSLMRFKCVDKSWCALIRNPYFREQHSALRPDATHLLIPYRRKRYPKCENAILTASPDGGATSDHTFPNIPEYGTLSCCHGLISMHPRDEAEANTFVYNPNTRETLTVPFNANAFKYGMVVRNHIGFEPVSNQYKLMILSNQCNIFNHCEIITLGTKDWRQVVINVPHFYGNSTYLNGALHWLTFDHLVFDLKSENFGTILGPERVQSAFQLCQVHGRLVTFKLFQVRGLEAFELWTLKDYSNGVWVKESFDFSVPLSTEYIRKYVCVIGGINNDEILICVGHETFGYDMKTKKGRKINVRGEHDHNSRGDIRLYTESMRCY